MLATGIPWGADNGAFGGFDPVKFVRMLHKIKGLPNCLFVVAPDVVGKAMETCYSFLRWFPMMRTFGQPIAFVAQDGQENRELPNLAWWECLFIGGTTAFKLSRAAADLVAEAKRLGKWVHVGRVNSLKRIQQVFDMGADSWDGTATSRWGDAHIQPFLRWAERLDQQPTLFQRPR